MATTPATRAPWHLWAVGILGSAWNSFGVFDYIMTKTRGEAHLRDFGMTDAQIAYVAGMPAWMTGAWAVGVFGALAGTLLLLLRSRLAVPVFAASLAAFLATLFYNYFMSDGAAVMGQQGSIMNIVIFTICVFFLLYARAMARRGVLR
jgi:hypothetical protein